MPLPPRLDISRLIKKPDETAKPKLTLKFGKELSALLAEMEAREGSELVLASAVPRFNVVPSGIFQLDLSLGGGWAEGTPAMVYGYGNAGKTTTLLKAIASIQRKKPHHKVVLCDCETSFDPGWAICNGVDLTRLLVLHPVSGEEACDIMLACAKISEIAAIFLDSIPTLIPTKDYEDSLSDFVVATRARLLGRFSSNYLQTILVERQKRDEFSPHGHFCTFYSSNSWRNKIGVMFGDPRTLPGGEWQHIFHMTKVEIKAKEETGGSDTGTGDDPPATGTAKLKKGKAPKGSNVSHTEHEFVIRKAKIPGPRAGEFHMMLDPNHPLGLGGVNDIAAVGAWCKKLGVLRQSGANLVSDLFDYRIADRAELEAKIMNDGEFGDWLRLAAQVKQRVALNLPPLPPDGFLVTPQATRATAPGKPPATTPGPKGPAITLPQIKLQSSPPAAKPARAMRE